MFWLSYPRIGLTRWLEVAFLGAAMNAALSLPSYWLVRRLGWNPG